jgi:hypothetical protein
MPNNNLPSNLISTLLAEKVGTNVDTSRINSLINDERVRSLNYEILYKFLESAVEEFILVNHGNPLADDFRKKVIDKMGDVLNLLIGKATDEQDIN